jgi:hypothetical protein
MFKPLPLVVVICSIYQSYELLTKEENGCKWQNIILFFTHKGPLLN